MPRLCNGSRSHHEKVVLYSGLAENNFVSFTLLLTALSFMGNLFAFFVRPAVTVAGERYTIVRRLGEGGYSVVELVRDRHGAEFALKRIGCSVGALALHAPRACAN